MAMVTRLLVVASILSAVACAPAIDHAMKVEIDQKMAQITANPRSFPPGRAPEPMPFRPGQWIQHKLVDEKGTPSLMTYKIVGEEGGGHWVEVTSESYTGRQTTKMLVDFGDRRDLNHIKLLAVKQRDSLGRVADYSDAMVPSVKLVVDSLLSPMVGTLRGLPQEDAQVPAGRFSKCYKGKSLASARSRVQSIIGWWHPAVPINGMIKAVGIHDPTTIELVAFGETGAISEF